MKIKRIICFLLVLLTLALFSACSKDTEKGVLYRGRSEPVLDFIDVQIVNDTLYYSYGSSSLYDFKLFTYDLKQSGEQLTVLLDNVQTYYATENYVFYIPYKKTGENEVKSILNHKVVAQNDTETLVKLSKETIIYRYNNKTKEREEFLRVPYLLDFRIIDNKIYMAYEENFTKGDKNGKFDNSKRTFYSYVIDCVSLEDSSVRENILRLNYAYKDFYEEASSEFLSHLPTENVRLQDSLDFDERCIDGYLYRGKKTYLYGIHDGKLYFRYTDEKENLVNDKIIETLLFANVDLTTKVTVDLFECEDVGSKAGYALFFGEENITLSYSKIANATQYIIKEVFGYNGEKLEEKTTETEIRSARQHLEVTDNNSRYVHDENGKVWFFDVSDKLNNAYDGNVKKVHPEYDFGLHPRLLYASEDMVVFEEFKNRTTPIRLEAILKDGTVRKIPITWIGTYPPEDQINYATPYGNI